MSSIAAVVCGKAEAPPGTAVFVGSRDWAVRTCQGLVFLPLFALILLPEYVQGLGDPETKSLLYRMTIGPWRVVDLLLLGLIGTHAIVWSSSRRLRIEFPRRLVLPAIGFAIAIALALAHGALSGGVNLFFDWRALALGAGLYGVFAAWLQSAKALDWAVRLFAGFMAARMAAIFAEYLWGQGDVIVGKRIPVFDGPTLSAMVFAGMLAVCLADCSRGWKAAAWLGAGGATYLLVVLCFRRTFWAELGVATLTLLLLDRRGRAKRLLPVVVAVAVSAVASGSSFYERVQSMEITRSDTHFSEGNRDHVGELLDAWEQARAHPVAGIGLGRSFPTLRIQGWKEESVMVHNAPLHVWLKYGLLGVVCYVWFHVAMLLWLRRVRWCESGSGEMSRRTPGRVIPRKWARLRPWSRPRPEDGSRASTLGAFSSAALAYLAAQFVVSLGFAPWPYSSVQSTTLIVFILAVAVRGAQIWNCRPSR